MTNFRTIIEDTPGPYHRNSNSKEILHKAYHNEIFCKKVTTTVVTESIDVMVHIKHPPIKRYPHHPTRGNSGGRGGGPYDPAIGNRFYPNPLTGGHNSHYGAPCGGDCGPKMICMVQVQTGPYLLHQRKCAGKRDKIGMSCELNLNRV